MQERTGRLVRTLLFATGVAAALSARPAGGWEDRSTGADMPWLGSGGRAHLYFQRSSCFGCPTGYKDEERWGRSAWSGEHPYVTVGKAMSFLFSEGGMANAAKSIGASAISDGSDISRRPARTCEQGTGAELAIGVAHAKLRQWRAFDAQSGNDHRPDPVPGRVRLEVIEPRALPYHMTVVMIEPTVIAPA